MSTRSLFVRVVLTTLRVFAAFVSYALIVAATDSLVGPRAGQTVLDEAVQGVPLVSLASACTLAFVILRSTSSGSRLAWQVALILFASRTLSRELDAATWLRLPSESLVLSLFSGGVFAAIWAPLAVVLLGRSRGIEASGVVRPALVPAGRRASMLGGGVLVYLVITLALASFVAGSSAAAAAGHGAMLPGALPRLDGAAAPWLLVELARGALWTLVALVVTRMSRGSGLEVGLTLAALFVVSAAVHLPAPILALAPVASEPPRLALALSNGLFGLLLGPWFRWRLADTTGTRLAPLLRRRCSNSRA